MNTNRQDRRGTFLIADRARQDGGAIYTEIEISPHWEDYCGNVEAVESLADIPAEGVARVGWGLYGRLPDDYPEHIGDFRTIGAAIEIARRMFGDLVEI